MKLRRRSFCALPLAALAPPIPEVGQSVTVAAPVGYGFEALEVSLNGQVFVGMCNVLWRKDGYEPDPNRKWFKVEGGVITGPEEIDDR
jgi:hypothetical protein